MSKLGFNIGSGQRPFSITEDVIWVNVDSQEKWHPDILCDASSIPYESGHADYVVLHHVLEHFGCGEGMGLVKEAYRLLKPGGSLLVFVPDIRALARRWLAGGLTTQIYVTNLMGAFMGDEADRHKWNYDPDSLTEFLVSCAEWTSHHRVAYRPIPGADIAHDWWILGMECVK